MKFLTKKDILLRRRDSASHKGDNGRVLVIGGSLDYVGAVLLAGVASLRAGADQVVIAAPEKVALTVNSFAPDIITKKFAGDCFAEKDADEVIAMSGSFDAVLMGNGIGLQEGTQKFAARICEGIEGPKVIDADAIKVISLKKIKNAIMTPHQKELQLLLENSGLHDIGQEENFEKKMKRLKEFAGSNVFLIKGKYDAIVSKDKMSYNKTGNEGMTKGGTGDVLAGITAAMLAQEKDALKAACAAAYISGEIGDILKKEKGYGFLASDMINKIPEVMKRHWR